MGSDTNGDNNNLQDIAAPMVNNEKETVVVDIKEEEKFVIPLYNIVQISPNQFLVNTQIPQESGNDCFSSEIISEQSQLANVATTSSRLTLSPCSTQSELTKLSQRKNVLTNDYFEMRRKNNESCSKYRQKKKEKEAEQEKELKLLEEKN